MGLLFVTLLLGKPTSDVQWPYVVSFYEIQAMYTIAFQITAFRCAI